MEKLAKKVFVALNEDAEDTVTDDKNTLEDGQRVGVYELIKRGWVEVNEAGKVSIVEKKKEEKKPK